MATVADLETPPKQWTKAHPPDSLTLSVGNRQIERLNEI